MIFHICKIIVLLVQLCITHLAESLVKTLVVRGVVREDRLNALDSSCRKLSCLKVSVLETLKMIAASALVCNKLLKSKGTPCLFGYSWFNVRYDS